MSANREPEFDELKEAWIESLVRSASLEEDQSRRISKAMQYLAGRQSELASLRPTPRRFQLGSLSLAATLLLAVYTMLLLNEGGAQVARAAIDHSLHMASRLTPLKYVVRVEFQLPSGHSQAVEGSLVVQGHDRFLLERPGLLPGAYFRIGRQGDEFWVLPPVGPVLVGDQSSIAYWLQEQDPTEGRLLHINFLLNRMKSRQYRLSMGADEAVKTTNGDIVQCQRVSAVKSSAGSAESPDKIELWASRESGMAVRILASWELSEGQTGRKSFLISFQSEQPGLTAEWFRPETHYEGSRPTIRFESQGD